MKVLFVVRAGNPARLDDQSERKFIRADASRSGGHPATRLRVIQYLEHLKDAGIDTEVIPFPSGLLEWWRLLRKAKESDIVFFQKKRVHRFWLKRIKAKGAKLIYDFDDAVMFNSSRHPVPESPLRMRHFVSMVKRCHGIIAGNSYLKSLAEPYNKNIWILPTTIDTDKYRIKNTTSEIAARPGGYRDARNDNKEDMKQMILGWIGGSKSLVFLKALQPMLDRIAEKHSNVALKIVCDSFFESGKMPIIKKAWSEADEAPDVLSFDIGLAPLPDDPWSRGKCATKLLQYMASGIPAVASAVGAHNEIIRDNVNGCLAKNDNEWFDKLSRLIEDVTLRQRLGAAARQTADQNYSVKANAPKLEEILRKILCV
jgi:glycosyltransferase involved in cell wall biosynthesis